MLLAGVTHRQADEAGQAFLDAACRALRAKASGDGDDDDDGDPLVALGWWDLLPELADTDTRAAALVLFRAQGRELGSSPALGALMAAPYVARAPHLGKLELGAPDLRAGRVVATISRRSARHGDRLVVLGDVAGLSLLVDRPGHGAVVVGAHDVELRPIALAGQLVVHEVEWNPPGWNPTIDEHHA
nr:hypothetical protein [Micromonospora sp. DSM 115978]